MCADKEVHKVVSHLRSQSMPDYKHGFIAEVQSPGEGDGYSDELYDQAVTIVTASRRASISGVQRRLKIGYSLAASLIEMMEVQGIVSPPQHNGNREVLAPPPPEL